MRSPFGDYLEGLFEAKGLNQSTFAHLVATSQSMVSSVISGVRTVPPDRCGAWAEALELTGDARQIFLDMALVSHLPSEAQQRFATRILDHHHLMEELTNYREIVGGFERRARAKNVSRDPRPAPGADPQGAAAQGERARAVRKKKITARWHRAARQHSALDVPEPGRQGRHPKAKRKRRSGET